MMHLSLILSAVILTNAIDVANAIIQHSYQSQFQLSGTVATVLSKHVLPCILIKDTTGSIPVAQLPAVSIASIPSPGDIVKIEGKIIQAQTGNAAAIFDQLDIIGHSTPPRSITTTIRDVKSGHHDWNLVTVRGRVHECFIDDIDPNWRILVLNDNGNFIYTAYHTSSCVDIGADTLFDAEIDFTGICFPRTKSWRQQIGRTLTSYGENPIHIVTPSPPDKFNAPRLNISTADSPESIHSYGHRVIEGEVIACWEKSFILLKDISSDTHVVKLISDNLPDCGQIVEAVGIPYTDLYHINLSNASWKPSTKPKGTAKRTSLYDAKRPFTQIVGFDFSKYAKVIRLKGSLTDIATDRKSFTVSESGQPVTIDLTGATETPQTIAAGSVLDITGVYIISTPRWEAYSLFPRPERIVIAIQDPTDIRILKRPPWLTFSKLLVFTGFLLTVMTGILFWNTSLRRASTLKGRQLMREQLGHVKAELKTEERTRLAVELHDSLAQTLTGVSLEIDTAGKLADETNSDMLKHLGIAARTLKSCRDELRNCLWDLRNRALEAKNINDAIRQTLTPHIAGAELVIRFNVPRARISDNTAHTILRIIRELTLNAIRHGKATKIWIAGNLGGAKLKFSVRDNGSGFNPAEAPGFSLGHYGLLGIRERIDTFEGEFRIDSTPGKGTKATIAILAPQEEEE